MTMTTCPGCGVAVVAGYVKCPRCGARLPAVSFRKPGTTPDPGGTAVAATSRLPWWVPVAGVGAVVVIGIVIFAVRGGGGARDEPAPAPAPVAQVAHVAAPVAQVEQPPVFTPSAPAAPAGPSPAQVAETLRHALDHQRLWSTVRVVGSSLEIRSASCSDPQMKPAIDAAAPTAHAVGLTRVRCLEESGAVAVTRDL